MDRRENSCVLTTEVQAKFLKGYEKTRRIQTSFFIFLNCVKCQGLTFGKNGIFTLQQHFQWVYSCCLLLLFIRWMPFKRGHLMHENGFTAHVKDMSKTCLISECPNILLILEATHLLASNSNSVRRKFRNFYYVHVFRAILWLWFLFDSFFLRHCLHGIASLFRRYEVAFRRSNYIHKWYSITHWMTKNDDEQIPLHFASANR